MQRSERAAELIHHAFGDFLREFNRITSRSRTRFETRDWHGCETDAVERLGVYPRVVACTVDDTRQALGPDPDGIDGWKEIKRHYSERLDREPNGELARTFFNSVCRRIHATEGVRPEIEFTMKDAQPAPNEATSSVRHYPWGPDTEAVVRKILDEFRFAANWTDFGGDVREVAARLDERAKRIAPDRDGWEIEMFDAVFYRVKHAYLVGRIRAGERVIAFVVPLLHEKKGVFVDAVLFDEDDVSILFSFTRWYFHVVAERPGELVRFLSSILPQKPVAELYISIGYHKHGKTELYRALMRHLDESGDRFVVAPGDVGMVMLVFTVPNADVVFKIIRDTPAFPKTSTTEEVKKRYRIVFERDRVGRLVDAQSFQGLQFPVDRFAPDLLDEMRRETRRAVKIDADRVILEYLYMERQITPLNIYIRTADDEAARAAVIDYGRSIRELAAANIFPGDFLLKNFGVTRHGRVVFYDYDELCLVTDCKFRKIPPPRNPEDELAAEPWFSVSPEDVFPEEFRRFLGLPADLLRLFEQHHGDLFEAAYWRDLQRLHRAGAILDVYPYDASRQLDRR